MAGAARAIVIFAWGLITIAALLSLALSVYSLNVWDRLPADQATRYFQNMTPQDVQSHADYQNAVVQAGLSLSGYAFIFTTARILGGLALILVGFLLLWRYNSHVMAVLMACFLSVFAAAGIWENSLFSWAVTLAPWMNYPASILTWLLWCGVIVIYTFPNGRFTPRWTLWLAVLVVPLSFLLAFNINIFLNPDNWPSPLYLLPNLIFIGGGFFAILYRYFHLTDPKRKQSMRGYVISLSVLLAVYFVDYLMMDVYTALSGNLLIQGYSADVVYVLVHEPVWYALEIFFAVGLAVSVFRRKLLED